MGTIRSAEVVRRTHANALFMAHQPGWAPGGSGARILYGMQAEADRLLATLGYYVEVRVGYGAQPIRRYVRCAAQDAGSTAAQLSGPLKPAGSNSAPAIRAGTSGKRAAVR